MSTTAIVVIGVLFGLLMAGIILIAAAIVWLLWQLRKLVTGLKADVPLLMSELQAKLSLQTEQLNGKLARINGDELRKAAADSIAAAKRIEGASLAFAELTTHLLSGEGIEVEKANRAGLAAEDYAPNPSGERYVGQSSSVAADAVIESGKNSPLDGGNW